MKLPWKPSLKHEQILVIWISLFCATILVGLGLGIYELIASRVAFRERLWSLSDVVRASAGAALAHNDENHAGEILSTLHSSSDVVAGCLCTSDGRILARFQPEGTSFAFPAPRPDGVNFEKGHFLIYRKIDYRGKDVGVMCLQSAQVVWLGLPRYAGMAALLGGGCLAFTLALSAWLQRLLSRRILELARAARNVAKNKDYSLRVMTRGNDEFGGLIDDFNDMLGQIQAQDIALHQAQSQLEDRVYERTRELRDEIVVRRRAEELLREQVERISLINQLTRAVVERVDLASVFHVLLGHLEHRLLIDFASGYTLASGTKELVVAAHGPESAAVAAAAGERVGESIAVSESFLNHARKGEIFELLPEAGAGMPEMVERLSLAGIRCAVVVPLQAEGALLGALVLGRCTDATFPESEKIFLRTLSEHVALAARQTRLFTELQTAYTNLHTTQQAALQQERLRALGQMASGIAHDINNALTPIMGFADLLERTEVNLSANARRCIAMIKTAAEDITITVGRMKEFYRQRKGDEPLTEVDLNMTVQQAVDLARPRWRDIPQQRGIIIDLRTDLDSKLNLVHGNESEIRQALVNLIINAVDALPQGGSLMLRTRQGLNGVATRNGSGRQSAQIEVIDTGLGMDAETRRRCLEPFYSTKGSRGTGLGLAMVFGVMERHDGRIEIDSALGRGTTIRLVFPTIEMRSLEVIAEPVEPASIGPLKVLCIDDEPLVLQVMEDLLGNLGHKTQTAAGAVQGLHLFRDAVERRQAFDVVITDLGMPGMDGRTLAAQLKTESPETPIILLTGWGMFLNGEERVPSVVDQVLAKPPSLNEVQQGLLMVTRGRKALVFDAETVTD
jgi:signal transduction histidine kinase/ActR/RegA family two-component response regulator